MAARSNTLHTVACPQFGCQTQRRDCLGSAFKNRHALHMSLALRRRTDSALQLSAVAISDHTSGNCMMEYPAILYVSHPVEIASSAYRVSMPGRHVSPRWILAWPQSPPWLVRRPSRPEPYPGARIAPKRLPEGLRKADPPWEIISLISRVGVHSSFGPLLRPFVPTFASAFPWSLTRTGGRFRPPHVSLFMVLWVSTVQK